MVFPIPGFLVIYFLMYTYNSQANLPHGKADSVCERFLNPNKICQGNFLNFPLIYYSEYKV